MAQRPHARVLRLEQRGVEYERLKALRGTECGAFEVREQGGTSQGKKAAAWSEHQALRG